MELKIDICKLIDALELSNLEKMKLARKFLVEIAIDTDNKKLDVLASQIK